MTSDEISELLERAIESGDRPGKKLGRSIEVLMRPEKIRTRIIARISADESGTIQILFPEKRDDFRTVMHQFGYSWVEWCWQKKVDASVVCDRASEIAHNLLLRGFVVQVYHSEIRDKAATGVFEPEAFRIVKVSTSALYAGWFVFEYPRSDDLYDELMGLTAAKYINKRVTVPPENFAEVEDFAEHNDFQFSAKAREALENARSLWETALLILPAKKKRKKSADNPLNNLEVTIPDALKDDLD